MPCGLRGARLRRPEEGHLVETKEMNAKEIVRLNREYTLFSWSVQSATAPIPMVRAEGIYFWDADGKRYLDFSSQLMNLNIGHQHPKVVRAIQEQAGRLSYAHPSMATEPRGLLGRKIAEVAPGNLKRTFFCLGGAEANENAIKMARFYTGRHKILARYRSYHGATHGALALTGDYRRLPAEPTIPGVVLMEYPPVSNVMALPTKATGFASPLGDASFLTDGWYSKTIRRDGLADPCPTATMAPAPISASCLSSRTVHLRSTSFASSCTLPPMKRD